MALVLLLLFDLLLSNTPFLQHQHRSLQQQLQLQHRRPSISFHQRSASIVNEPSQIEETTTTTTTTTEIPWFAGTNDQVWETRQIPNIFNGMRMHRLPRTDILISEVGLGTMNFGQQVDQYDAYAQLDLAYNKYGINFIDTHELFPGPYSGDTMFRSERIIGRWMHDRGIDRSTVVLCSKLEGYGWDNNHINLNNPNEPMHPTIVENGFAQAQPAPKHFQDHYQQQHEKKQEEQFKKFKQQQEQRRYYRYQTSKEILQLQQRNFIARVNAQCQRLGTDYLDVLLISSEKDNNNNYNLDNYEAYINNMNEAWNLETTINLLETLSLLVKMGKIRHYGLVENSYFSTINIITTAQLLSLPKPVLTAVNYNLLERFEVERGGVRELCMPRPSKHPLEQQQQQQQLKQPLSQQQLEMEEDLSLQLGFMPLSPLAGGALSGKYHINSKEKDPDRTYAARMLEREKMKQARHFRINKFPGTWMGRYLTQSAREATEKYLRLMKKYSLPSLASIALPFVASRPFTSTTLMSATSVSQLEDNILQTCNCWMTEQLLDDINAVHRRNTEPTDGDIIYERFFSPSEHLGFKKDENSRREIEDDIDLESAREIDPMYLPWGSRVADFDPGELDDDEEEDEDEEETAASTTTNGNEHQSNKEIVKKRKRKKTNLEGDGEHVVVDGDGGVAKKRRTRTVKAKSYPKVKAYNDFDDADDDDDDSNAMDEEEEEDINDDDDDDDFDDDEEEEEEEEDDDASSLNMDDVDNDLDNILSDDNNNNNDEEDEEETNLLNDFDDDIN